MLRLLRPPRLASEDLTQRARTFHRVVLVVIGVSNLCFAILALARPELRPRLLVYFFAIDLPGFLLLALNRRGRTRLASGLFVTSMLSLVTIGALSAGGVRSPGVGLYFVFVLLAGQLLGLRAGVATAVICAGLGLGLVLLEATGKLPPRTAQYDAVALWLINAIYMGLALALMRLATQSIESALHRAEAELAERQVAERERERLVIDLKERVKELTLLHSAARLLQPTRAFEPAVLEQLVASMPAAWMHPECCVARIVYRELDVRSPGWRESPWQLRASFDTGSSKGTIEVAYLEQRPEQAQGPFLAEEAALLRSLVEMLAAYLDYHEAEAQRRELERQLRHAQKMDALGKLAGGIAHDFNNILMAMGFNVELARQDVPAHSPAREYLDEMLQAHERAKEMVKQILLFARKQEPERKLLELDRVVQEALKLLRATLSARVTIGSSCELGLPPVLADASQIHQVLMNLGTNAGHAMQEHGGDLSVELSRATISDARVIPGAQLTPGTYVCVTVRDTGMGMSHEVLDRLFEPFFTTKGYHGTGLGLSVVHGIVREHRGAITVRSEIGRGSSFTIYLPAAEHAQDPQLAPESALQSGHGERIMYVDDEPSIVLVVTRLLERLGYVCVGFTDARAALQAFKADPRAYDAVITDGAMPVLTGPQMAAQMRALRPDLPIALASAHSDDPGLGDRAGIAVRIAKPPSVGELARALRTMLDAT